MGVGGERKRRADRCASAAGRRGAGLSCANRAAECSARQQVLLLFAPPCAETSLLACRVSAPAISMATRSSVAAAATVDAWRLMVGEFALTIDDFEGEPPSRRLPLLRASRVVWSAVALGCPYVDTAQPCVCGKGGRAVHTHDMSTELHAGDYLPFGYGGQAHPTCDFYGEVICPFVTGFAELRMPETTFWGKIGPLLLAKHDGTPFKMAETGKRKMHYYDPSQQGRPFVVHADPPKGVHAKAYFHGPTLLRLSDKGCEEKIFDERMRMMLEDDPDLTVSSPPARRVERGAKSGSNWRTPKEAIEHIQHSWCPCPAGGPRGQPNHGAVVASSARGKSKKGKKSGGDTRKRTGGARPPPAPKRHKATGGSSPPASDLREPASSDQIDLSRTPGPSCDDSAPTSAASASASAGMSMQEAVDKLPKGAKEAWKMMGMPKIVELVRADSNKRLLFKHMADRQRNVAAQVFSHTRISARGDKLMVALKKAFLV